MNRNSLTRLQAHNREREEAKRLAGLILDDPSCDPDGDEAVLARQFLRVAEAEERIRDMAGAAPDLFTALRRLLAFTDPGDAAAHKPGCGCVLHEARAAIDKAGRD